MTNYSVIYEVNLVINNSILDDYLAWLKPHMEEITKLDGFVGSNLFKVENLGSEHLVDGDTTSYTAVYYLSNRQSLQDYFDVHAARLRGDGVNRFKDQFNATRRILTLTTQ
jgi:hypothetical protein